ncbi:hypothetical protein [Acinetobacter schindleri]|uniref:hypothetical protein n=1 Tax=Acinetobacter schindleri TaxID=108981 RepID=UPI002DBE0A5A|nr:hypothetical protein [Acinetobacter schindleri]MEB5928258.1 hypothetical protein [Acinetobacter schindleri]
MNGVNGNIILINLSKKILYLIIFFITFFFIFGVKTPIGSLGQILTACIIFMGLFFYNKKLILMPKFVFFLLIFLLVDISISLVWPIILNTYDFSIIPTKVNLVLSIISCYILSFYFYEKFNERTFFRFICLVFLVQSLIVFLMLINSDFSNFIMTNTKDSAIVERMVNNYSGSRGLGLADSAAFGFSVVMALFILIVFYSFVKKHINIVEFLPIIFFGTIASISAGRISILGLILGLVILVISLRSKKVFIVISFISVSSFFTLNYLIGLRYEVIEMSSLSSFYNFMMEPIFSYIDYGVFATSSTDGLKNMYFTLSESQFIYGDAKYSEGAGYYMGTDAGYMRFSLFYGAINSLYLYMVFFSFLFFLCLKFKNNIDKIFMFLVISLSFMLHYKGEVVLFSISYNKLLFLVLFFLYFNYKIRNDSTLKYRTLG